MKKFAKLLVLLLTVALIAGAIAIVAGAEGETFDLAGAIAAADDNGTVTLDGNAAVDSAISITKNVTIDLNGYTITSTAASVFTVDGAVTLNIVGEGNAVLAGNIASVNASDANLNVKGESLKNRIEILHNGEADDSFLSAGAQSNGTIAFENVSVESTYAPNSLTAYKHYVQSDGNATLIFTNFDFYCGVKYIGQESNTSKHYSAYSVWFAWIKNSGTITLKNSVVNTTGSGIRVEGAYAANNTDVIVSLENSTIKACSADGITRTFAFGTQNEASSLTSKGTILVKDSVVEATYAIYSGGSESSATEHQTIVDVQNSHVGIRSVNNNTWYDQDAVSFGGAIKLDATSTLDKAYDGIGNNFWGGKGLYLAEGTRYSDNSHHYNIKNDSKIVFPDGSNASNSTTYDIVFDPAGNPSYPYVVVKLDENGALPEGIKDLQDGLAAPNIVDKVLTGEFYFFNFSEFFLRTNATYRAHYMDFDGAYYNENRSGIFKQAGQQIREGMFRLGYYPNQTNADEGSMEFYGVQGTVNSSFVHGNEALKYWVSPQTAGSTETTRDFSGKDTYFVLGTHRRQVIKSQERKVAVFDIDIGTDSGAFPYVGEFGIACRTTADAASMPSLPFTIDPDGTFKMNGNKVATLSTTEWNHITAVCYTDNTYSSKGKVYYYLDGELIGENDLYNSYDSYIQGFRISMAQTVQTVGSSIVFDNLMIRAYNEYLGENEANESGTLVTPNSALYNFYNAEADYANRTTSGPAAVNGIIYPTVNEALAAAAATDSAVTLLRDVEEIITNPGIIITNGHKLTALEGSLPSNPKLKDGQVYAYDFDEKYSGQLTFAWYVGNLDPEQFEENKFVETTVSIGQIPTYEFSDDSIYSLSEQMILKQTGWSLDEGLTCMDEVPLTSDLIKELTATYGGTYIFAIPYMDKVPMSQAIVDAGGNCVYATEDTVLTAASFRSGCTTKLFADCTMSTEITVPAGTVSLDVAGNEINISGVGSQFKIGKDVTFNVCSSAEGGRIQKFGSLAGNYVSGNALFHMLAGDEDKAKLVNTDDPNKPYVEEVSGNDDNCILNIGTVEGIEGADGKNLTVLGDGVVEPRVGDYSCEANIIGATLIKVGQNYGGIIFPRYYNGSITVDGATLINASGSQYLINAAAAAKLNGISSGLFNSTVEVKNSVLIARNASDPITTDFTSIAKLTYENSVVYGRPCWSSDASKVTIGENVATWSVNIAETEDAAGFAKGIFFNYNKYVNPEIIGEQGYYKIQAPAVVSGAIKYDRYLYILADGVEAPADAAATIALGKLTHMSTKNPVTVTFTDLDGETVRTEQYAKGGNVAAPAGSLVSDVTLVAIKKVFAGWQTLPENIQENATVAPNYDVKATVEGLKANLSLYSDFDVNLYIPEQYKNYVSVKYGETVLEALETSREGYYKVSVGQLASEASSSVKFEVTVTEEGESVYLTVTLNVATYAETILATEGYTEEDKTLMTYIVAYANEAYKFANGGVADETLANLAENYPATEITKNYEAISNPKEISDAIKDATVILQSAPKFQFTIDKNFVGTVEIGGTAYTYETVGEEDRVVTVEGTKAYNFLNDITLKVGEAEGKYNYSAYAAFHVDNAANGTDETSKAASEAALALIHALYEYASYATTYNANK